MLNCDFMRKEDSLPVRLETDEKRRLKAAAERMGMTVSALIRLLVRSFVDEYERQGGRLAMPPDWEKIALANQNKAQKVAEKKADYPVGKRNR